MNWGVIIFVLVVLSILWIDPLKSKTEAFEPDPYALTTKITQTLRDRGVRLAPNGIRNVTPIDVTMDKPVSDSMIGVVFGGSPAFTSRASARLRIITRGGDTILTPTFTVQGKGETRVASQRDASTGLMQIAASVRQRLTQ